jgi:hypothetical protein
MPLIQLLFIVLLSTAAFGSDEFSRLKNLAKEKAKLEEEYELEVGNRYDLHRAEGDRIVAEKKKIDSIYLEAISPILTKTVTDPGASKRQCAEFSGIDEVFGLACLLTEYYLERDSNDFLQRLSLSSLQIRAIFDFDEIFWRGSEGLKETFLARSGGPSGYLVETLGNLAKMETAQPFRNF